MTLIDKVKKNNFIKSVFILTSATALAQLISALLTPFITRIYTPEEFGILTVYSAILGILSIIGSLKLELGITIADDDEKAVNVLALSLIMLVVFVGIISFMLLLFGVPLINIIEPELSKYMFLIPFGVFLAGMYNIITQWAIRMRDYNSISKTKLNQSLFQNAVKIVLGILLTGPIGLILGNIIGQSAGISTLLKSLKKKKSLLKKISLQEIRWCFKRYIRFPLYSAPSQFLNTAGISLPILFITSIYGGMVIGYYGLANLIVNLPMNLIGRSVANVFYGEAAKIGRTNPYRIKELSNKLLKILIIIGLFPLIVLIFFGPNLFSIVFGSEWYEAGVYASIISILVFSRLIFTPFNKVFTVYERQKDELILDILRVILVFITFGISKYLLLDSYLAIALYSLVMTFVYLITFLKVKKIINEEIKKFADG